MWGGGVLLADREYLEELWVEVQINMLQIGEREEGIWEEMVKLHL